MLVTPSFCSCRSSTVLFSPLSSATSTGSVLNLLSGKPGPLAGFVSGRLARLSSVSSKRNTEPVPGILSAEIVPPISSTMDLQMDKPSPVPSADNSASRLTCEYGRNRDA
ncbi:hypothetical protein D3C76_1522190 [compost metagenome]